MEDKPKVARMPFLDDLRGLAVVAMFVWHTTDAWLRPALKSGQGFTALRIFGGMAAPLFLFLAGTAGALKWLRAKRNGISMQETRRQLAARGAGVMVVGYGLRLSMWLIDGGAIVRSSAMPIWLPQLVGLFLLWLATEDWGQGRPRAKVLATLGLTLWALGIGLTLEWAPRRIPGLLRVDVLQSIGASLMLLAVVGPYLDLPRRGRTIALGSLVFLATLTLGTWLPGPLPGAVAGYVAAWAVPSGVRTMAMFPLAPWLGYALFGVAFGATVGRPLPPIAWRRSLTLAVCFCASLGALCSGAIPEVGTFTRALPSSAKLIRAIHRVGIAVSLAALLKLLERPLTHSPLRVFGKTSLLLYCVHLEFAYGAVARPVAHRLDYVEWLVGLFLLMGMMYGLGRLRLHLGHRARRGRS